MIDAGNEALEAYYDSMKEREAYTPEVTTQRMLRLAQETSDIADNTINQLELQRDELARQQREVAEMHDDLNVADKKMKAVKSGWGNLANITSSKKNDQYTKGLNKWEEQREKNINRQEREDQKNAYAQSKVDVANNSKFIKDTNHDLHKEHHDYKKQSRAEAKNVQKGRQEQREETVNFGGFIFEERIEGTGPKHQSERDLEELAVYTQSLKEKAYIQAELTQQTTDQIQWINDGVSHADARSKNLNYNMNRYVKKHG